MEVPPEATMEIGPFCSWEPASPGAGRTGTSSSSTAPGTVGADEEEDEWPENPWQAQADAHALQLRQVTGNLQAYGIPGVLCDVALRGVSGVDRGLPQAWLPEPVSARGCGPDVADAAAQTDGDTSRADLEGQLALQEDALASRDKQIGNLRARLDLAEQRGAAGGAAEARRLAAEVEATRQDRDELRRRNDFLSAIVSRFERKTMDFERQIDALGRRREAAEVRAEAAERDQEALRAAVAEADACRADLRAARARAEEAHEAARHCEERCAERAQEAEGATIALRELKREHNRRVQELLRKVQLLERSDRSKGCAEPSPGSPELQVQGAAADDLRERDGAELRAEMQKVKELNGQLIERLTQERADHAETRESLERTAQECDLAGERLGHLSAQLGDLAEANDGLQEELDAANAACCAAATGIALDAMS